MPITFSFQASGGIQVYGKARFFVKYFYAHLYNIAEIVYSRQSASQWGLLEALVIKRIKFPYLLYTDTLNGLWNEEDLCNRDTALLLIQARQLRIELANQVKLGFQT